ncbi:hypothetical protein ABZP36_003897 [Zizania latifolia]
MSIDSSLHLDIEVVFEVDTLAIGKGVIVEAIAAVYSYARGASVVWRGLLGLFSLLVLANENFSERMVVFFYLVRGADGNLTTFFCQDELKYMQCAPIKICRSSKANDLVKRVYDSLVPVLDGKNLALRILMDINLLQWLVVVNMNLNMRGKKFHGLAMSPGPIVSVDIANQHVGSIPRMVLLNTKTGSNLLQWLVVEVENLRMHGKKFNDVVVSPGSIMPLDVSKATQKLMCMSIDSSLHLDIEAVFKVDILATGESIVAEARAAVYSCGVGAGAVRRGSLGPFRLLVLADEDLSSKANDLVKRVYDSLVPVLDGENLALRILLDIAMFEVDCLATSKGVIEEAGMVAYSCNTSTSVVAKVCS